METIESGKHYKVDFIQEACCVRIQWFGLPTSDEFRSGCNAVIDLLISRKATKVLTDNSKAKVFSVADRRWLNDDWLPRAEKVGYRASAVIFGSSELFIKYAVDSILQQRDSTKFMSKQFSDTDQALVWLKSLD